MKYTIKQNVRVHIITFVFLLILSLTAMYILLTSSAQPPQQTTHALVPGLIILEAGTPEPFAENATLKLINSTVAFPNCADCMETARVEVVVGNQSKMLQYRFGGIAGFHDDTMEAFGYSFILRELNSNSVTIEYKKLAAT